MPSEIPAVPAGTTGVVGLPIFVDTTELQRIAVRMGKSSRTFPAFVSSQMRIIAHRFRDQLEQEAPANREGRSDDGYLSWQQARGGPLKDSFVVNHMGKFEYNITEAAYGVYVREGTAGGYPIYPRFANALWWPGLDHPIPWVGEPFTALHPGISQPNPYDLRSLEAVAPFIELTAERAGMKVYHDMLGTATFVTLASGEVI